MNVRRMGRVTGARAWTVVSVVRVWHSNHSISHVQTACMSGFNYPPTSPNSIPRRTVCVLPFAVRLSILFVVNMFRLLAVSFIPLRFFYID